MPTLIPFESRPTDRATVVSGTKATILDVATPRAQRRPNANATTRPSSRNWDPAFHVNLLTF